MAAINQAQATAMFANMAKKTSAAVEKKRKTARNKFEQYLQLVHNADAEANPYSTFEESVQHPEYFTEDVVGGFYTFLSETISSRGEEHKYATVSSYAATFSKMMRAEYGIQISKDFTADARHNTQRLYNDRAAQQGHRVSEQAPLMTRDDLETFCRILFDENELELRAALALQWHCMGRVGEPMTFRTSSFTFCKDLRSTAMKVSVHFLYSSLCRYYQIASIGAYHTDKNWSYARSSHVHQSRDLLLLPTAQPCIHYSC